MSFQFKIVGGTAKGGKSLCDTCSLSIVAKGYSSKEKLTFCCRFNERGIPIPFPVRKCKAYWPDMESSVEEYEKTAVIIDPNHNKAGFGSK